MSVLRVKLCGRNSADLVPLLGQYGLEVDNQNPEVVISYGGDGTLLGAERDWPGVPKVALRDSRRCRTCSHHSNEEILDHLAKGILKRVQFMKLRATVRDMELSCLNDIIISNSIINMGVRCLVQIDGDNYTDREVVGDGLVVATPFGSTAYFCSISRCLFRVGIGLAFNNSTEHFNHVIMSEDSVLTIKITRGPAIMAADNNPSAVALDMGDEIVVRKAAEQATMLIYDRGRFEEQKVVY